MRLIDADALIENHGDWYTEEGSEEGFIGSIKQLIETLPSINLVRCKDCIHRTHQPDGEWCSVMARYTIGDDDGYCAWGEPKGEE